MTFVGFTSGILLAYLLESLSDTISTSEEARTSLDLPLLGSVPTLDRQLRADKRLLPLIESEADANKSGNLPPPAGDPNITLEPSANGQLVTISAPHTAISEALRTIRANILLSSADYPPRVILMSSAAQGEGKTTILANLGVTLAQANHRTLVIDGDLRMAGLTELFRSQTGENIGLSELLTGQANLERTIYPTMVSNLDIIPAGCKAPNPAELVGSESMRALLTKLKERYDFILLDSPPVGAVADALLLSRMVDSVLFVVRAGVTPRAAAREARQRLAQVKARVIGVVINGVSPTADDSAGTTYGANYYSARG
jgi:capsular exopolysaccharide synthesis family protein